MCLYGFVFVIAMRFDSKSCPVDLAVDGVQAMGRRIRSVLLATEEPLHCSLRQDWQLDDRRSQVPATSGLDIGPGPSSHDRIVLGPEGVKDPGSHQ